MLGLCLRVVQQLLQQARIQDRLDGSSSLNDFKRLLVFGSASQNATLLPVGIWRPTSSGLQGLQE